MLHCSFQGVPSEMLLNPFYYIFDYPGISEFRQCTRDKGIVSSRQVVNCFAMLHNECVNTFDLVQKGKVDYCYKSLSQARTVRQLGLPITIEDDKVDNFTLYMNCTSKALELIQPCIQHYEKACQMSRLRVIKEVWMDLRHVLLLIRRDPDLKVIHLVRDPRGILLSRKNLGPTKKGKKRPPVYKQHAEHLCTNMDRDLRIFEQITKEFPDAAIQIRYEDLVMRPSQIAKSLYDHVGFTTDVAEQYYLAWQRQINNPSNITRHLNTYRHKSEAEAYDWINQLTDEDRKTIENIPACVKVIQNLHYPDML